MKIQIFVEGVADQKFLIDYIKSQYNKDLKVGSLDKNNKFQNGDIINLGGKDKLFSNITVLRPILQINSAQNIKNIIILDADDKKNGGGFEIRKTELENLKINEKLDFEYFLLPNNQANGDLEDLLTNIINPINQPIFNCWADYEKCLINNKIEGRELPLTTPAKKTKIYAYLEALLGETKKEKDKIKEANREYQKAEYWSLSNNYLLPLKIFFDKFFNNQISEN